MTLNDGDHVIVQPTRKGQRSHKAKSILQSNPKYQTGIIPVVVDADKRDDQPQQDRSFSTATTASSTEDAANSLGDFPINSNNNDDAIPDLYVDTIVKGFGPSVDLYKDVLRVSPDAAPRQLRICYFRRGREVLSESGVRGFEEFSSEQDHMPEIARTRFQAVSMAYEIVTKPAWKQLYLEEGLRCSWGSVPANSRATTSRSSCVPSILSVSSRYSVRWNEQVEELVYDREPEEQPPEDQLERKNRKKGKNAKTRIFIEEETELDEHLAKLDAEAEPHFVSDFLDNLEESLDGLLKFGGNRGEDNQEAPKAKEKANKKTKKNKQVKEETSSLTSGAGFGGFIERVTSNDEDSIVGRLTNRILGRSVSMDEASENQKDDVLQDSALAKHVLPLSSSEEKQPAPFRCVSPDPCREDEDAPDDELFDVGSITFSTSGSVSSPPPELKATTSEDIFDGIEDELIKEPSTITLALRHRPTSPGNVSMVSDLSESVANRDQAPTPTSFVIRPDASIAEEQSQATASSRAITPNFPEELLNEPEEDVFDDIWCNPAEMIEAFPFSPAKQQHNAALEDNKDMDITGKRTLRSSNDDGFLQSLASYILAMVHECQSMGTSISEIDWKDAITGALMVEDDEVDYLMNIVASEIQKTPSLHSADATEAPTLLAIEAARSFS